MGVSREAPPLGRGRATWPQRTAALLVLALLLAGCQTRAQASPTPTAAPAIQASPPLAAFSALPPVEVAFPDLPPFPRPVFLTHAGDGTDRLFLVLQAGQVLLFSNNPGVRSAEVFLDIRERVNDEHNEEGLLGLAFDPDFPVSGSFYVFYTASDPRRSVISRFSIQQEDPNRADPASEEVVLEVPKPFGNHNGGMLLFGPDGYLYIGLGDGGAAGDPFGNGQNLSALLGKILRIDPRKAGQAGPYAIPPDNPFVGVAGAREEVWAYGLRNPWRFSADRATGTLWAGDVGQDRFEEIDIILPGRNYGWNRMEGLRCFPPRVSTCDQTGLEPPLLEYPLQDGNCSVTGGYVYRGTRLPALGGAYIYADFCSGRLWGLRYDGQRVTDQALLADTSLQVSSFGEDPARELYILSFDGRIYRLKP